jgi:hypothetical protein
MSLTTSLKPSYVYFFTVSSPRGRVGQTPGRSRANSSTTIPSPGNKHTDSILEATQAHVNLLHFTPIYSTTLGNPQIGKMLSSQNSTTLVYTLFAKSG